MTARGDRPTSREISCVRPPIRPFTDSRSDRVFVDAGSMAYSAVTQPSPDPLRHLGTPSLADAAHSTRVLPNSTSTDPAAWSSQFRRKVTGRSSSLLRPSARVMSRSLSRPVRRSAVQPGDELGVGEGGDPRVVRRELLRAQQLAPGSRATAAEEGRVVLEDPEPVRAELRG